MTSLSESKLDLDCPVCMEPMMDPVRTPCGHAFCRQCIGRSVQLKNTCPMCRARLPGSFEPARATADAALQAEAARLFPAAAERAMAAHAEAARLAAEAAEFRRLVVFGNRYEEVAQPKVWYNKHRWTAFVEMPGVDARQYIDKVVFGLHDTFGCDYAARSPPYECKRVGWGTFEMEITIHWRRRLRMPPLTLEHELVFAPRGGRGRAEVDFAPNALRAAGLAGEVEVQTRRPRGRARGAATGRNTARRSVSRRRSSAGGVMVAA